MPNHKKIKTICQSHDFPIRDVITSDDDEILQLVPESLEALPDAETLQRIGDELRELGWRYVTIQLQ